MQQPYAGDTGLDDEPSAASRGPNAGLGEVDDCAEAGTNACAHHRVLAGILTVAIAVPALAAGCGGGHNLGRATGVAAARGRRVGAGHPVTSVSAVHRRIVIGRSADGRTVVAYELRAAGRTRRVLVVGCIHGDEPAGVAVAQALLHAGPVKGVDLWVVPVLNPDGLAAATRGNGDGVDLNRNFPFRWRPVGPGGTPTYAGPRALSEPESTAALSLLERLRPALGIWYHQALDVVDDSQGPLPLERRYAALSGLPVRPLPDYPGSAVGEEDHLFGPTAFVVELPARRMQPGQVDLHVAAVHDVAALAQ